MCEPTTLFLAASVASAALGAYSNIQAGNAAYQSGMYNAQIAERNAQAVANEQVNVKDAAAIERRRLGERVRAERGQNSVNAAAMGVDPGFGSPFDIDENIASAGRADAGLIGRNELNEIGRLDKERADYLDSARMSRSEAKGSRRAGFLAAAGSLLEGASSVSSRWIQPTAGGGPASPRPKKRAASIFSTPSSVKVGGG